MKFIGLYLGFALVSKPGQNLVFVKGFYLVFGLAKLGFQVFDLFKYLVFDLVVCRRREYLVSDLAFDLVRLGSRIPGQNLIKYIVGANA